MMLDSARYDDSDLQLPLVLIVDDDDKILSLLKNLLEREGYQVIEAKNQQEALELYQKFQPEMVIIDPLMPVIDDISICQDIHTLYNNQAFMIMAIGVTDPDLIVGSLESRVTDDSLHPIHQTILRQKVLRTMRQTRRMKQLQQNSLEIEYKTQIYDVSSKERSGKLKKSLDLEMVLNQISDNLFNAYSEFEITQIIAKELSINLDIICCNTGFFKDEKSKIKNEYIKNPRSNKNYDSFLDTIRDVYMQICQDNSTYFCPTSVHKFQERVSIFLFVVKVDTQPVFDISIICNSQRVLDDVEIRFVNRIISQSAIAIRQLRLYETVKAQERELADLRMNR